MSQSQTPPPPYAPGGPPPGPAEPPPPRKAGLFDLRFTRFLSLSLISAWWAIALVVIGVAAVAGVVAGLVRMGDSVGEGLLWMVGSLVGGVVLVVLTRLFLESVAVLFRIADNTSDIAAQRRF